MIFCKSSPSNPSSTITTAAATAATGRERSPGTPRLRALWGLGRLCRDRQGEFLRGLGRMGFTWPNLHFGNQENRILDDWG